MGLLSKKASGTRAGLFVYGGVMQYVEISEMGRGVYRVEQCIDAPYDLGEVGGELFSTQKKIEENLRALKKAIGKKWASRVYAGIQSKDVLLRTFELPQMSIDDARDAFRYEFDKFFPIPVDEAVYDVTFIDRPRRDDVAPGTFVDCIAAAVRSSTVENLMMAAQRVDIKLGGIEPSPVAMLRCLMGPAAPQGFNVYALAGVVSSIIVATYRDNGIVYRNTTQSFATEDTSGRTIDNFTRDLQATVNFASTQMRGFSAEKIYIGGYGANQGEAINASVSEAVNCPVSIVNPWKTWNIANPPTQQYGWEVALGLALRPGVEVR
ncbi:MAG: pilus assembly protein PilM [Synergistaceae bacterium]|jgi:type IV pilus assembly protein PilM|nr:pilus assembly protein PilM [Synergistaceae bacterium]